MPDKSITENTAADILELPEVAIPCTVFSRVVGYYSATQGWNPGKKEEFKDRETYDQHGRTDRNDSQ